MLRNGCCAWDPARVVRAPSHVCHVRVPRPRLATRTHIRGIHGIRAMSCRVRVRYRCVLARKAQQL
eukprot:2320134-Prymnesium_polylepis.1